MTAPIGAQEQILSKIKNVLLHVLPPGWDYAQVKHSALGDYAETAAIVQVVAGPIVPWEPPAQIGELFGELRAASAAPGTGTWLTGVVEINHPESYQFRFNATKQPEFRGDPPETASADELRRFPRDEDKIPDWLGGGQAGPDGA